MFSRLYLEKTVWSGICEIPSPSIEYYGWIPKPKETTRAVKNKNKNVYKFLQVASCLPEILHEIVALLDHGIFCGPQLCSIHSDTEFSLHQTVKLVSYLSELRKPFDWQVKSKTAFFHMHSAAACTKERSFRDFISHTVNSYFRNCAVDIDTVSQKERAAKIETILGQYFPNFITHLVLLAVSGNYLPDVNSHRITPFEYGSFAILKLVENLLAIVERK